MRMHSDSLGTTQIMRQVIYALSLGVAMLVVFQGFGVLWQMVLAIITAVAVEALMLSMRKQPILPSISDGSAVLSAILLAVSIPSIAPWWLIVLGVAFAIVFGKQLYGGLGNNPFNPAMLGYAFLLISYPLQMTSWPAGFVGFTDSMALIFSAASMDAYTGATQLDSIKTAVSLGNTLSAIDTGMGDQVWISLGFLLGGIYLLFRRVITWHIPLSFLLGIAITSGALFLLESELHLPPIQHLLLGGTMLGAFFIATDPVTAATTIKGRILYGLLIGVLIVIIRTFGGYPDAIAFSVLLMNMTVPLIDYYTRPRVFGR